MNRYSRGRVFTALVLAVTLAGCAGKLPSFDLPQFKLPGFHQSAIEPEAAATKEDSGATEQAAPAITVSSEPQGATNPQPEPAANPQPEPAANPQPEPVANPQPEPAANPQPEPVANPQPQPAQDKVSDMERVIAADHAAIQQLVERDRQLEQQNQQTIQQLLEHDRQLEKQVEQLKTGGTGAAPSDEQNVRQLNQRISKLENQSTTLVATFSRLTAGQQQVPDPAALPSFKAELNHEIGTVEDQRQAPSRQLYRDGLLALLGHRWFTALEKFDLLRQRYPKSELNERTQYFSAVALYQAGKYQNSIAEFRKLMARQPNGPFTSTALYSEAMAFLQVKDKAHAQLTLKKLLADHADSPEAPLARVVMKNLEGS